MEVHGEDASFLISPTVINALIFLKSVPQFHCDWLQVNHLKVFLLSFGKCILSSGRGVDL